MVLEDISTCRPMYNNCFVMKYKMKAAFSTYGNYFGQTTTQSLWKYNNVLLQFESVTLFHSYYRSVISQKMLILDAVGRSHRHVKLCVDDVLRVPRCCFFCMYLQSHKLCAW